MQPPYDVRSPQDDSQHAGAVYVMLQGYEGRWLYTLAFDGEIEAQAYPENQLRPTSKTAPRSQFYAGDKVRVRVAEDGSGEAVG